MDDSLKDFLLYLLNGAKYLTVLGGFAFAIIMNMFYLPKEYKKGNKCTCFVFIAALLYTFGLFWAEVSKSA